VQCLLATAALLELPASTTGASVVPANCGVILANRRIRFAKGLPPVHDSHDVLAERQFYQNLLTTIISVQAFHCPYSAGSHQHPESVIHIGEAKLTAYCSI
jgi:hypothetical protein